MKLFPVLLFLPTLALAQPLILPPTDTPTAVYDANGQRYDILPSPLGATVVGPGNERLEIYEKSSGGSVAYDQDGTRVFESYPSLMDTTPAFFPHK